MISNEKIYKIAKGLIDYLGTNNVSTPTSILSFFSNSNDQSVEYIRRFGAHNCLKIVIAMWGIHQGKTLPEIEVMYENLFFATMFYTEGRMHEAECDECNGNGSVDCDYCDGRGEQNCDTCDGEGEVECNVCNGDGEVEGEDGGTEECDSCEGEGTQSCDDCDSGTVTCNYCSGNGSEDCDYCDGQGTIESDDEMDYEIKLIASWNPNLKNKCELENGTLQPVMKVSKFEQSNSIIFLADDSSNDELSDEVEPDKVYCIEYLGDNMKLDFKYSSRLQFSMVNWDVTHLLA